LACHSELIRIANSQPWIEADRQPEPIADCQLLTLRGTILVRLTPRDRQIVCHVIMQSQWSSAIQWLRDSRHRLLSRQGSTTFTSDVLVCHRNDPLRYHTILKRRSPLDQVYTDTVHSYSSQLALPCVSVTPRTLVLNHHRTPTARDRSHRQFNDGPNDPLPHPAPGLDRQFRWSLTLDALTHPSHQPRSVPIYFFAFCLRPQHRTLEQKACRSR
jgi:hypothetical protein